MIYRKRHQVYSRSCHTQGAEIDLLHPDCVNLKATIKIFQFLILRILQLVYLSEMVEIFLVSEEEDLVRAREVTPLQDLTGDPH